LKLLADENVPWPLVKKLMEKEVDVVWIPATNYRELNDEQVLDFYSFFIENSSASIKQHGSLLLEVQFKEHKKE